MSGPFQGSDINPATVKSGQGGPTPRAYSRHQRHRKLARIGNGADQFSAFLAERVATLSSTTAIIFGKLTTYTAAKVKSATNISNLP